MRDQNIPIFHITGGESCKMDDAKQWMGESLQKGGE